jgi:hypothetical protein
MIFDTGFGGRLSRLDSNMMRSGAAETLAQRGDESGKAALLVVRATLTLTHSRREREQTISASGVGPAVPDARLGRPTVGATEMVESSRVRGVALLSSQRPARHVIRVGGAKSGTGNGVDKEPQKMQPAKELPSPQRASPARRGEVRSNKNPAPFGAG